MKNKAITTIKKYVETYGSLTTYQLQADHSPLYASNGNIVSLIESFTPERVEIVNYDTQADIELDSFYIPYPDLSLLQLLQIIACIEEGIEYLDSED